MHRIQLIELLEKYKPINTQEIINQQKIIEFITKYADCFERSCVHGHITGSAFLLDRTWRQVLLMEHKKLNKWLQFGGHCDGNPDVLAVAIREAQEESGINDITAVKDSIFDLDIHLIPQIGSEPAHFHFDIRFLLQVNSDEVAQRNHESNNIAWFGMNKNQLPTSSESLHRMFEKWAQIGHF